MGLINIQNTNFENGITNRNAADLFGSMGQLDPTHFHNYMEDFDYFTAADFTFSGVGAGSQALADVDGGVLRLSTAGADNDSEFAVKNGQSFLMEAAANRKQYFRSRQSVDDETDSDLVVGLADGGGLTPNNGVFFRKDDDAATLDVIVRSGSADIATATAIATITTAFFTTAWYWDGIDRIYYGVDGTPLGFLDLNGLALPVGELQPAFGVQAGAVAVLVGDFDWVFAAKERS